MKQAEITKTIKKAQSLAGKYSLGFARLDALPARVRKNFSLASLLEGTQPSAIHSEQKQFLASLSNAEFKNWLYLA